MKSGIKILLATSALAACVPTSALAQVDDEIIITATRRAESIQDVPIAVTAILPETIQKQGVVNIQNLTSVAPSFSTSNAQIASGSVVLRIRGVGTTSNNIGFESAVGVFIDGAYQSRPGVALGEFVDVERVEVLRGPQGTLFGRNTSAGALNVTNVRPQMNESGGFVNATYGNYDHMSLQGAINIPIAEDSVAARLSGAIRKRDGYVDIHDGAGTQIGESNGVDQLYLRGQLGFEGNRHKARLIVDYSDSNNVCCSAIELLSSGLETGGLLGAVGLGARGGMSNPIVATNPTDNETAEAALAELRASSDQVPDPSSDQIGFVADVEYALSDDIDLAYVGSYREYSADEEYDSDFSGLDIFNVLDGSNTKIDTMTHELRLQGNAMDGKLDWLVGAYYSDEDITQATNFGLGQDYDQLMGALFAGALAGSGIPGVNPFGLGATPYQTVTGVDPSVVRATNNYAQNSESFSLFTHNIFDVTEDFSVTVGLRYTDESKTGSFSQSNVNNPLCRATLNNLGTGFAGALVGSGVPPAAVPNFIPSVFGLGCFAFTAPADLPEIAVLPLPRTFNEDFKDDELIYTGKLAYEFSGDATAYASFTHGYKSGGFNLDSTAAIPVGGVSDPSFLSETVDAYEVGLKTKLADGRITLNVAAFLEEFENFQVLEFTGAQFVTFNVPKAETKGVEIEMAADATDNLSFTGGLTLLDANYPDDCAGSQTSLNVTSLCGNTLTNAPKTVGILGANYDINLTENLTGFINGQIRYEGDRRTSTQAVILASQALNPFDIQEATTKINLRAGFGDADDDWALEAWATNLTNEITRGVTFNTVLRSGSRSAFVQEPRMYGMTVRKNF